MFGLGEKLVRVYNLSSFQFYSPQPDELEIILLNNREMTTEGKGFLNPEFHNEWKCL